MFDLLAVVIILGFSIFFGQRGCIRSLAMLFGWAAAGYIFFMGYVPCESFFIELGLPIRLVPLVVPAFFGFLVVCSLYFLGYLLKEMLGYLKLGEVDRLLGVFLGILMGFSSVGLGASFLSEELLSKYAFHLEGVSLVRRVRPFGEELRKVLVALWDEITPTEDSKAVKPIQEAQGKNKKL